LTFAFDADPDTGWLIIGTFDNPALAPLIENNFRAVKHSWTNA
jgi:hypothetical protein